jgi:adenine-specific DNA-methyltransferase
MSDFQAETRFIELMAELFQLDEAEALDFGLYRLIRRHNREVRAFLGEIVTEPGGKTLRGGRLGTLLAEAFQDADAEAFAEDRCRLAELEQQLGLKPGLNAEARNARLDALTSVPATAALVDDYRARLERQTTVSTAALDRREVLNRLYQFFSRHYQDGDFIVARRYGRDGSRYLRSTGEDTEFHWATEDLYYIKSSDIFTDFPVMLANGQRLVFTLEPETLAATRAALKPNDRAHYELHSIQGPGMRDETLDSPRPVGEGPGVRAETRICLSYLKGARSERHKDEIVSAAQREFGADGLEIRRWLNRFIARNQSDFFIHQRLGAALTEDLDLFLKTVVLDADQLLVGGEVSPRALRVARVVRDVGRQIIAFLAALADYQKTLWEKKKLVFATRYVITLDRIEKLAGREWLEAHLDLIVRGQREEWRGLGLGEYADADACRAAVNSDLLAEAQHRYLPLPVDTGRFTDDFKWALLEAVSRDNALDQALDGVAIHSDNWQALNLLQAKYRERVKCVYIDPPYNTGSDGFPYKDAYAHASWLAMIHDRLQAAAPFLVRNGALFASIDHVERHALTEALARTLGRHNRVEEIIWGQNTTKNQSPTYSTNHEYVEVFARDLSAASSDERMFREPKPGAAEVLELVERLNPDYPPVAEIEAQIKTLFERHRVEFRDELDESGIEYDRNLDPWKGLYNYQHAEYRDEQGRYVPGAEAQEKRAKIWVWQEDNASMPAGKQAESTNNPKDTNYRFYKLLHPVTGKLCSHPKRGWCWPQYHNPLDPSRPSLEMMQKDDRIFWGPNEKKTPRLKKFLHEVDTQVSKSLILDYTDGEKELTQLAGKSNTFPNPKPTTLIERFILQTTDADEWVMDFFAGSGTTFHAAVSARHDDRQRRRVLLIEGGAHFEPVLLPRLKRVGAAWVWKNGKPTALNGPGLFLRVQTLEQYEDTLANLDIEVEPGQSEGFDFDDPAFSLRYRLRRDSRAIYGAVERFASPFGYQLQRAAGGGEAQSQAVDLIESVVYLLGLDVTRLYREPPGAVILGSDRRGQTVALFFRDCNHPDSTAWLQSKLAQHPADRLLTNDPATLAFEGCDRFEAVEAVFAGQFGRS